MRAKRIRKRVVRIRVEFHSKPKSDFWEGNRTGFSPKKSFLQRAIGLIVIGFYIDLPGWYRVGHH